jgi:hypothetical protein
VAVTGAGGNPAAALLTIVAYLIGIAGFALVVRARAPAGTGWDGSTRP